MSDVTEFTYLDTEELHLVGMPANGFASPLLAKAAEALDEELALSGNGLVKYVSAAARHRYASSGVAMANGDFPIPDEGHLRSAVGRLAEYTGDKAAAKAHIVKRAKALGLVHLLPKEWNVQKETEPHGESKEQTDENVEGNDDATSNPEPGDGGTPRRVPAEDGHVPESDGQGDTAPDKALPKSEALSQTEELGKTSGDGTGSRLPDGEHQTAGAENEAKSQTREMGKADADSSPGSPAWEHKDVALGEKAERLVAQLADVVHTFTEREKAEGGDAKKSRRLLSRVKQMAENPILLKEIAEMDATELLKALDEHDAARRAEKKAAKKAARDKAEKKAAEAAKAADKAAKAAGEPVEKSVEQRLAEAEALIQKMADVPAARPFLNGAGVAAALRNTEARESVFKEMDDRVAEAEAALAKAREREDSYAITAAKEALRSASFQRTAMKMVAAENARERDPQMTARTLRGQGVPLISNRNALADDSSLRAF